MVPLKIASNFTCPKKQRKRLNPVTLCYLIGLGSLKLEHTVLDIDLLKKMGLYCLLPLVVEFFFNVYWIYQRSSYITYTVLVVWRHERRENLPDNASFSQLYGLYMHIWSCFFVIIALSCIPSVQYFVVSWCLIDISLLLIPELYPVYELTTTQPNKTTIDTWVYYPKFHFIS